MRLHPLVVADLLSSYGTNLPLLGAFMTFGECVSDWLIPGHNGKNYLAVISEKSRLTFKDLQSHFFGGLHISVNETVLLIYVHYEYAIKDSKTIGRPL